MSDLGPDYEYGWGPAPRQMTRQDELFMRAVELACTPVWSGIQWECRCRQAIHGGASHTPAITQASLVRAAVEL
jgi:hypothetical protein